MRFTTPIKVLSIIWMVLLALVIAPFGETTNQIAVGLITFLLVAHVVEFMVFQSKIKNKPQGFLAKFLFTLVYGLLYIKQRAPR